MCRVSSMEDGRESVLCHHRKDERERRNSRSAKYFVLDFISPHAVYDITRVSASRLPRPAVPLRSLENSRRRYNASTNELGWPYLGTQCQSLGSTLRGGR